MKVFEKLTEAVTEEGMLLSLSEGGKAGKSKMIASCSHIEEIREDDG